jgi:hypothetical protein
MEDQAAVEILEFAGPVAFVEVFVGIAVAVAVVVGAVAAVVDLVVGGNIPGRAVVAAHVIELGAVVAVIDTAAVGDTVEPLMSVGAVAADLRHYVRLRG